MQPSRWSAPLPTPLMEEPDQPMKSELDAGREHEGLNGISAPLPSGDEGLASPREGRPKGARLGPPLVCQVPGCGASLASLKEYYQRYKICQEHRQMDQMVGPDGQLTRFCQQCGRFHLLTAFDDTKRSCRERLARHNERRRRRVPGEMPTVSGGSKMSGQGTDTDSGYGNEPNWSGRMRSVPSSAMAAYGNAPLSIWEQRQLQVQALQMQELEAHLLTTTALDVQGLSGPFNVIQASQGTDFSSDLSSQYSQLSASEASANLQLLAQSRLMPRMLVSEENMQVLYARPHSLGTSVQALARPNVIAAASADVRAQRKTLSWPLAQLRIEDLPAEQQGLITGANGTYGALHHTFPDGAVAVVHGGSAAALPYLSTTPIDGPSSNLYSEQLPVKMEVGEGRDANMQLDVRVLGENQTLDSIWENIMLVDDNEDV